MYIYDIHNIPWKSLMMNLKHIFIKYLFICITRLYNNDVIFCVYKKALEGLEDMNMRHAVITSEISLPCTLK